MGETREKFEAASNSLGMEVFASFQKMENGESRTRLTGNGTENPFSYIRVELPVEKGAIGAWQKAHSHNRTIENWIVEKGCQIVCEREKDGSIHFSIMEPGSSYSSRIGIEHNCFVFPGTITHTVKTTVGSHNFDGDWIAAKEIDKFTKAFDMVKYIKENDLEKYL